MFFVKSIFSPRIQVQVYCNIDHLTISAMSNYQQLPDEIIVYILSYLPLSSLFRLKSVCKLWNTLFLHPDFAFLYEQHKWNHRLNLDDLDHFAVNRSYRRFYYDIISQTSHGLLLERSTTDVSSSTYRLRCPLTLQKLDIPSPQNPSLCIALDFVPSESAIKLVSVHQHGYEILPIGIGSDQTSYCWRPLIINLQQQMISERKRIQVFFRRGVAYCISYVGKQRQHDDLTNIEIDVLNMVNESYIGHTTLPTGFFSKLSLSSTVLMDWNGQLSFAELVKDELHVLVLDDYSKLKWDETRRIIKMKFLKPDNKELMIFYTKVNERLFFASQDRNFFCGYNINTGELTRTKFDSKIDSGEEISKYVALLMFYWRDHQLRTGYVLR